MDNSWKSVFLQNADTIISLSEHLDSLKETVYPSPDKAFKAFKLCPYDDVKVVIVGQDPYPSSLASGLAFSIERGEKIPASMKNIHKMVENNGFKVDPNSGNLEHWAKQGVLLLNVALSVVEGKPKSHLKLWREFFRVVQSELNKKETLAWLMWGRVPSMEVFRNPTNTSHMLIECTHPSPANPEAKSFINKKCLLQVNDFLKEKKIQPIDWRII